MDVGEKLSASDVASYDCFRLIVSISGDTLIVGAPEKYYFVLAGDGLWG